MRFIERLDGEGELEIKCLRFVVRLSLVRV